MKTECKQETRTSKQNRAKQAKEKSKSNKSKTEIGQHSGHVANESADRSLEGKQKRRETWVVVVVAESNEKADQKR